MTRLYIPTNQPKLCICELCGKYLWCRPRNQWMSELYCYVDMYFHYPKSVVTRIDLPVFCEISCYEETYKSCPTFFFSLVSKVPINELSNFLKSVIVNAVLASVTLSISSFVRRVPSGRGRDNSRLISTESEQVPSLGWVVLTINLQ